MYQSSAYYFSAVPGVYSETAGTAVGANAKMNSNGGTHYRSIDNRKWFLRDTTYGEPSGDYTKKCWLGAWGNTKGNSIWSVLLSEDFSNSQTGFTCGGLMTCGNFGSI